MRDDNWFPKHWEELGVITKFPRPKKIDELKVGDNLQYADVIRTN